jgi:hypothetical protein
MNPPSLSFNAAVPARHAASHQVARVLLGVATIASLLTLSWMSDSGAAPATASSLLAAALHDATSETSVHEVALTTQSSTTEQEDNDIGAKGGIQQFAVSNGALADVIALDAKKKLYIRGNTYALTNFFGLDLVDPASYANDWLLVTPKDPNYGAVALATTLASDFGLSLDFKGHLALGRVTTVDGQRARAISGTVPAQDGNPSYRATVYVSDGAKPLPVTLTATISGATYKATWTKWGEKLKVVAPKGAIAEPISTTVQ